MRHLAAFCRLKAFLLFAGFVFVPSISCATTTSTVDPTYPATNDDIDSDPLRLQFQATYNDINSLWAAVGSSTGSGVGIAPPYYVLAGPVGVSPAAPSFRQLVGNDLPLPSSNSIGGVKSFSASAHNFLTGVNTSGSFLQVQPSCGDLSDAGTACRDATGTSGAAIPLLNANNTFSGLQNFTGGIQVGGVSLAASATTDTTNAANITSGTLPNGRLAALSSNQLLGSLAGSSPTGISVPNCTGALTWTSGTGFGCNSISQTSTTIVYPEAYGALGNAQTFFDGAMTGSTLTSNTANFVSSHVNDLICVANVNGGTGQLCGTITAVNSTTSITTSFSVSGSYSGQEFAFGHNDSPAFATMLSTAPCSTFGCKIQAQAAHYALNQSLVFPAGITVNLQGVGPGVPNTANAVIHPPAQNSNSSSELQWLTKSLTSAALSIKGSTHVTSSNVTDYVRDIALKGGVGTRIDGGGSDGIDVLNWQNALFDNVYVFNFSGYGAYVDGLAANSYYDYIENIYFSNFYATYNGLGGIKIGSTLGVNNIETTGCINCIIEGNGGPGLILAGANIQGFILTGSVVQWNNTNSPNTEMTVPGTVVGGLIKDDYFESDNLIGSQSTGVFPNTTGMIGIEFGPNYYVPASAYTPLVFASSGTALPSCSSSSSITAHATATVSDSTACTIGTTYVSGGSTRCVVTCTGGNWTETGMASYK